MAGYDVEREAGRRCAATSAWCFQTQSLDKALTVEENLRAQGHLHGLSGAMLREPHGARHGAGWAWPTAARTWWRRSPAACGGAWKSPRRCCTGRKCC